MIGLPRTLDFTPCSLAFLCSLLGWQHDLKFWAVMQGALEFMLAFLWRVGG